MNKFCKLENFTQLLSYAVFCNILQLKKLNSMTMKEGIFYFTN